MEKNEGITLVALVVTIIVLLILGGTAISLISGEEGLFAKTNHAASLYNNAVKNQSERLNFILMETKPVPNLTESNVQFKCTPDEWTNLANEDTVKVEISTEETGQYYTLQYSLDEGANWTNYTIPIDVTKNGQVVLARLSERSRSGGEASCQVLNIDTVAPKEFEITTSEIGETSFKINASTEDGEATDTSGKSGIKEYKYYIKSRTETQYTETTSNPTGLTIGETYSVYVEAYDNAGNKRVSNTIEQRTLTAVPNLVKGTNVTFTLDPDTNINPTKYGRGVNVTITENTQSGYTLQYTLKSNGTGWEDYTKAIEVSTYNTVITARLYDKNTGREGTYATATVTNIDILPPNTFNLTASSTGTTITVSASGTVTDANATSTSAKSAIVKYEYKLDSGSWITPTIATSTSYTFTGLTPGSSHTVSMRATDTAGNVREATYSISTKLQFEYDFTTGNSNGFTMASGTGEFVSGAGFRGKTYDTTYSIPLYTSYKTSVATKTFSSSINLPDNFEISMDITYQNGTASWIHGLGLWIKNGTSVVGGVDVCDGWVDVASANYDSFYNSGTRLYGGSAYGGATNLTGRWGLVRENGTLKLYYLNPSGTKSLVNSIDYSDTISFNEIAIGKLIYGSYGHSNAIAIKSIYIGEPKYL